MTESCPCVLFDVLDRRRNCGFQARVGSQQLLRACKKMAAMNGG